MMPAMKSVGNTVFGVKSGCQALRRCCLKAVSIQFYCLDEMTFSPFIYPLSLYFCYIIRTGRLSILFVRHDRA